MIKGAFLYIDWHLLTPVIILVILGLTTLFSINIDLFKSQLTFFIFSIFIYILFTHSHYMILKLYSLPVYILSIFFLLIILVIGIESRGAVRWIDIAGIRIQFSEIFKPFLIVSLSFFLGSRNLSLKTFFLTFFLMFPIVFLIYKQPDLGNALIYFFVTLFTLIFYGFPLLWFFVGGLIIFLASPVIWGFLHDYQRQRVLTFINPSGDPLGTSYNAIQSIIAVGSGKFLGKGLGEGTQSVLRFLPERHTDFIFATLTEELGFLGALVLLGCFAYLLYRIYLILTSTDDKFYKVFCAGAFFLILVQVVFNIGMNIGILPIVGITLPFVSYGGSSILSSFILLGLLSSVSKSFKNRTVLEIK